MGEISDWEDIKKREQQQNGDVRQSLLDGVSKGAPSLMVAYKYQEKAAKVGFDWDDISGVEDKAREEIEEIIAESDKNKKAQEIADLIFVLVNWLRWLDVDDPESIVRGVNNKFYRRFKYVEENAQRPLTELTLDEMDALWDEAKAKGL